MIASLFPSAPKWTSNDIPDLHTKVAIVTGANAGIGYETAFALARKRCKVFLACRSSERAAEAIVRLRSSLDQEGIKGYELVFLKCDLASLQSVKEAAEEFSENSERLDLLFCSGGISAPTADMKSTEGIEIHMATNVLGHFYLTQLLVPILKKTVPLTAKNSVRVIYTSSSMSMMAVQMGGFDLKDPTLKRENAWLMNRWEEWTVIRRYAHSKLCDIILSNKFDRELGKDGIVCCSVDPGGIKTEITRNIFGFSYYIMKYLGPFILYPAPFGAITQLHAGTSPEGADFGGKYRIPWAQPGQAPKEANDLKAQDDREFR